MLQGGLPVYYLMCRLYILVFAVIILLFGFHFLASRLFIFVE